MCAKMFIIYYQTSENSMKFEYKALIAVLILILILAVSGCSSRDPVIQYKTVEVSKEVLVPCIKESDVPSKPVFATTGIKKTDTDSLKVQKLRIEQKQHLEYESKLEALIPACVSSTP